jgi:hypothetical protein
MSGYYPDGVTGNEYAIAGADKEWSDAREVVCTNGECANEDKVVTLTLDLASYRSTEWATWNCPVCGTEYEYEGDTEQEDYDEDYYADMAREERLMDY